MAQTNAERAYELLKERIVTTQMRPGSVIDEAALVEELGLGRTPIREACKRLENERLVVVFPRRGMYVAEVTLTELRELEEVRLALETLNARLAVRHMTPAQLEDIERRVEERRSRKDGGHEELLAIDRKLHRALWRASHNSLLEHECARLFDQSMRMWYLLIDRLEESELHEEFFDEFVAAARARDEARAEESMREHILLFGAAVRQHL